MLGAHRRGVGMENAHVSYAYGGQKNAFCACLLIVSAHPPRLLEVHLKINVNLNSALSERITREVRMENARMPFA